MRLESLLPRAQALPRALLLLALTVVAGQAAPGARVELGVREALATRERVRIIVYLSIPPTDPARLELVKERVAAAQDGILNRLGREDFLLRRRFHTVPALAGEITARGLEAVAGLDGVVSIGLDEGGSGGLAQAVPLTNSDDVQALGFTGRGVTVAVLDSGVDSDHPDLGDDLAGEACFCTGITSPCCPDGLTTQFGPGAAEDDNGHGSNVTGIITSAGVVAAPGVSPDASIVAIKVLDRNNRFCCSSDIVAGLDWILVNRPDVDVVNMSLVTDAQFAGDCDNAAAFTLALASAIDALRANGVLSFAASGNSGSGTLMAAPACVANAISVGAVYDSNVGSSNVSGCTDSVTFADKVTCFTSSNASTDLFAPGAPITSDYLRGRTATYYGTSQAAPHAAGCAANLQQANAALDPGAIETALEATGVPVTDETNGLTFPRVDCLAALSQAYLCLDADHDGFPATDACPTGGMQDCDDSDPRRSPSNLEVCDGLDNDCDTIVDNPPPPSGSSTLNIEPELLWWNALPLATGYDVVRGDLEALARSGGDFTQAVQECVADNHPSTSVALPADAGGGSGSWFLVRAINCAGSGTYDSGSPSQVGQRSAEIDASTLTCP